MKYTPLCIHFKSQMLFFIFRADDKSADLQTCLKLCRHVLRASDMSSDMSADNIWELILDNLHILSADMSAELLFFEL